MTVVEVNFLGTTATIPTATRNQPCIYIHYKGKEEASMLFDCGEGTQRQIFSAKLNFMRVDHIFITHWHADHFAGLLGLLTTMNLEGRRKPLYIYAPEADKFVEILLSLGYWTKRFSIIPKNVEFEGSEISVVLDEKEFEVLSAPMKHSIPAVGYCFKEKDRVKVDKKKAKELGLPEKGLIYKKLKKDERIDYKGSIISLKEISFTEIGKKIAYSGDTLPCKNMIELAKDADLLIHDSTYFDEEESARHATVDDVIEIGEKAGAKKVVLTHISRRYTDLKELNDKIRKYKNVILAKDFMKIEV